MNMVLLLVNHGYVILGVNNRGSSGNGKTFLTADDQKHCREPLQGDPGLSRQVSPRIGRWKLVLAVTEDGGSVVVYNPPPSA